MELRKFIKSKRKSGGIAQPELADRAGGGLRFIRHLEQGKMTLRMDKVNQVLRLFGHVLGPVPLDRDTLVTGTSKTEAAEDSGGEIG